MSEAASTNVLLTRDDVRRWKQERDDTEKEIERLMARLKEQDSRLAALSLLFDRSVIDAALSSEGAPSNEQPNTAMPQAEAAPVTELPQAEPAPLAVETSTVVPLEPVEPAIPDQPRLIYAAAEAALRSEASAEPVIRSVRPPAHPVAPLDDASLASSIAQRLHSLRRN